MKSQITVAVLYCLMTQAEGALGQEVAGLRESIRDSFPGSYDGLVNTYGASDVPELLAMLHSEDEEEYWSRVVGVLGVVGDDDVADALIEFIKEPVIGPTYISQARHDARGQ